MGISIDFLIFKEDIEVILELTSKQEKFDKTEFNVAADNIYDSRLT